MHRRLTRWPGIGYLVDRALRTLARQPAYLAITPHPAGDLAAAVRPAVPAVVHIPGFTSRQTYLEYITPASS